MLIGIVPVRVAGFFGRTNLSFSTYVLRQRPRPVANRVQVRCYSSKIERKQPTIRELRQPKLTDFDAKGYILLIVPIAAFVLGTWQVQRRRWKINLIEELEKRTTASPVPLPLDLQEVENLEYSRVVVRGHFDHSMEIHIMPRALVAGSGLDENASEADRKVQGAISKSGANVVTAFVVESPDHIDRRILVNRGWVPRDKLDASKRKAGQIEGTIELTGVVRLPEKRQSSMSPMAANHPETNQWFTRDTDQMCRVLHTLPIFIDADKKSTVPGGPIGGQTIVTLRNEHTSYIITWYSLAAITFGMWARAYMIR